MLHGKKLAKQVLLPSVLEDDDAETESGKLQLGEVGNRLCSQVCKLLSKGSVNDQVGKIRFLKLFKGRISKSLRLNKI